MELAALAFARREHLAMANALSMIPHGVFVVDERRRLFFSNKSAQLVFDENDGLTLDKNGVVRASQSSDAQAFSNATLRVFDLSSVDRDGVGEVLQIGRPSGVRAL